MDECLSAFCGEPAAYDVLMPGDWWWSECLQHTAGMRSHLSSGTILEIAIHDPGRVGKMAPRDA